MTDTIRTVWPLEAEYARLKEHVERYPHSQQAFAGRELGDPFADLCEILNWAPEEAEAAEPGVDVIIRAPMRKRLEELNEKDPRESDRIRGWLDGLDQAYVLIREVGEWVGSEADDEFGSPDESKLAQLRAHAMWLSQPQSERRKLLDILLSNCTFDGVSFAASYEKPFCWWAEGSLRNVWRGIRDDFANWMGGGKCLAQARMAA